MIRSSPDPLESSKPARSRWSREKYMEFEDVLVVHNEQCKYWWDNIVALAPRKDVAEIKIHYGILVEYIEYIEARLITPPYYVCFGEGSGDQSV